MKKAKKYIKISWFIFLFILIVWFIAGLQAFRSFKVSNGSSYYVPSSAYKDSEPSFSYFESMYGLGPNYYMNIKTNEIVAERDMNTDSNNFNVYFQGEDHFEFNFLPASGSGWVLLGLLLIQYLLLLRKSPRSTIKIAQPNVISARGSNNLTSTKPRFYKTKFLIPSKWVNYIPLTLIVVAILIVTLDFYFIIVHDSATFWAFGKKLDHDLISLDIEFILPSILYLAACIANAIVVGKYMKEVEISADKSLDETPI